MDGWIKVHRKLLDSPIWEGSTAEQKAILLTILLLASHKEKEWIWQGKKYKCEPGQFITSLDSLAKKSGTSKQNVRTAIKLFEKLEFLTNQSTKTGRLITVVNWGVYQSEGEQPNKDTNKELTKSQQRANKELTPIKNDKNDKKINKPPIVPLKNSYAEFVTMTNDEYERLLATYGKEMTDGLIEILDNYKGANGKKYKSDYRAILNWVVKRYQEEQANGIAKKSRVGTVGKKSEAESRKYDDIYL